MEQSIVPKRPTRSMRKFYEIVGYKPEQYNKEIFNGLYADSVKKNNVNIWKYLTIFFISSVASLVIVSVWFLLVNEFHPIYYAIVGSAVVMVFIAIATNMQKSNRLKKVHKAVLNQYEYIIKNS